MLEILEGNSLVANGILNLAVAALLYALVKEKVLFRKNEKYGKFITKSVLSNVVMIAYFLILLGLVIQ